MPVMSKSTVVPRTRSPAASSRGAAPSSSPLREKLGVCQWFHFHDYATVERTVQTLRALGVRMIGTVSTDEKAAVAKATSVSAKTVRNLRGQLSDLGLIRSWPEKDEYGHVDYWMVGRTGAPR